MARGGTLSPLQLRAIQALLESRNVTIAAKRLKIGRRTLYRWLQEPVFREALDKAESDAIEAISRSILAGSDIALNRLEKLMIGAESEHVQLRAALGWLDLMLRLRDFSTWDRKLNDIEEALNGKEQ